MMSTIDETDEPSLTFSEFNQQDGDSLFYESRFLEDFQPVSLLGRGAFGRVFEARKLIDQKHYAVKRIKLPSNKEARAKVMREVTVLAELNHRNIVRYFHAWREFPPSGWQEVQDATQLAKLSSSHQQSNGHYSESEFSQTTTTTKVSNTPKSPAPSFASIFGDLRPSPNKNSSSNSSSLAIELATPNSTLSRNYDKYLYIQMELCRKESLAQWLETRQPAQDIDQMYRQILQAVAHLHFKGLIHRDLKPSNIFFAMDGTIKVGDLGLVKDMVAEGNGWNSQGLQSVSLVPAAAQQQPPQSPCKNHTDQIGTRLYMSPEQVASKPYNHKVDVYALAVILFELLVKFNTGSERAHVIPELKLLRFPPTFKTDHGAPVEQLLTEMLAVNPDRRPEVKDILEHSWISPKAESTIGKDSTKGKIKSPNKKESSSSSLAKKKYYKLLVIGDQNTGKTSIIHRYVHGSFRDKYEVTVGAGINFKEIAWNKTDHLTLEFFDIGGEERSRFMTSAFYRKAVGAFVVTDVTQPNGFQAATLWKKDLDMKLRMHDDTLLPCVLLINKCDGATADEKHSSNELDPAQVDRFCRHHQFSGWFDTSAKNDINIDEAVQFLVGKVLAGETSQEEGKDDQDPPKKLLDDSISLASEKNNHKKQKSWC